MNNKGSIWRKWDLQVGTKFYNRYTGVTFYGDKLEHLVELTRLTSQQINSDHKNLNNEEYAKLFVEHFVHYSDIDVIGLANHNSGEGIEEILTYLKDKKKLNPDSKYSIKSIFPGTEVGGNDRCHIIIVFNPDTVVNKKFEFYEDGKTKKRELAWKEYIERFLDDIKIPNPRFNNGQPANSSSLGAKDIICKCQEWDFVPVFPHITNDDGLWKELQESNRREVYNNENFGIVDIPLTSNSQDLRTICEGKHTSWGNKAIAVINTSDSESLLHVGNKFSYIKCDPTIKGLKHLFIEPFDRVRTGREPEIIGQVLSNRTKYLKSIRIESIQGYDGKYGKWFNNVEIPLNHELVAIIGNKGSGKSALADIIALCSNHKHQADFSFLNPKKFRDGKHAKNFQGTITWESETTNSKGLDDSSMSGDIELVKYLPQGYFERLTNEISSVEEFKKEIENVVYTHLNDDDKIGVTSFDELINKRKELIHHDISILKERLSLINQAIFDKEKKLNIGYKANIEAQIKKRKEELVALIEPIEVRNPDEDPETADRNKETNNKISLIKSSITLLEEQIESVSDQKRQLLIGINELKDLKQRFKSKEDELDFFKASYLDNLSKFVIRFEDIFTYKFEYDKIDLVITSKDEKLKEFRILLGEDLPEDDSFVALNKALSNQKDELLAIQINLGDSEKKYQEYLTQKKAWDDAKKLITGDINQSNSLKFFEQELKYLNENLITEIDQDRGKRWDVVEQIYDKMDSILEIYKTIKTKIDSIILANGDLLNQYKINIDASFNTKHSFQTKFLNYVSLNKTGTYYGKDNAENQFNKLAEGINWDDYAEVKKFLSEIVKSFFNDKRNNSNASAYIETQVDEVVALYDYLFSLEFLDYNYELRQGSKKLEQLSPGEKGALLLIFYLLLDNNDIPLIIDQPEDNLDNNSVANVLVPFIKKAKTKRQIILVTHNPNLAVVADAEQVIYVDLDKENQNTFSFKSGSIENPVINECIVKVLEGAMPAFNKRKQKYYDQ